MRLPFAADGLPDGNYDNPNDGTSYLACVAGTEVYHMPCASGPDGKPLYYLTGSGPDPVQSRADYFEVVPQDITVSITLGKATIVDTYNRGAYLVAELHARVTHTDGAPVFAALVTFTTRHGAHLASGHTDAEGNLTRTTDGLPFTRKTLAAGYRATFAGSGDGIWNPVSADGTFTFS
ncbi:hypothetical protein Lfu02_78430 [Longispora fulva]|nr:hypothetical protein Lfu02_78430 [Longispora fulva]